MAIQFHAFQFLWYKVDLYSSDCINKVPAPAGGGMINIKLAELNQNKDA
jgi:hypothetical protein